MRVVILADIHSNLEALRAVLQDATGHEPSVVNAPAIIVCTDTIWRNSCKYQAREYRHAFWDCGTILANTLAMSSASGLPAQVVAGFVDDVVNQLLDLDTSREVAILLAALGQVPAKIISFCFRGFCPGVRDLRDDLRESWSALPAKVRYLRREPRSVDGCVPSLGRR